MKKRRYDVILYFCVFLIFFLKPGSKLFFCLCQLLRGNINLQNPLLIYVLFLVFIGYLLYHKAITSQWQT